ncbi:hypothetical protein OIO90_004633 [Microbotryomycetes sp. JL221]|nr:hypothetical protein OIO90_004633 [Microbotryomycetes sp. JL221]
MTIAPPGSLLASFTRCSIDCPSNRIATGIRQPITNVADPVTVATPGPTTASTTPSTDMPSVTGQAFVDSPETSSDAQSWHSASMKLPHLRLTTSQASMSIDCSATPTEPDMCSQNSATFMDLKHTANASNRMDVSAFDERIGQSSPLHSNACVNDTGSSGRKVDTNSNQSPPRPKIKIVDGGAIARLAAKRAAQKAQSDEGSPRPMSPHSFDSLSSTAYNSGRALASSALGERPPIQLDSETKAQVLARMRQQIAHRRTQSFDSSIFDRNDVSEQVAPLNEHRKSSSRSSSPSSRVDMSQPVEDRFSLRREPRVVDLDDWRFHELSEISAPGPQLVDGSTVDSHGDDSLDEKSQQDLRRSGGSPFKKKRSAAIERALEKFEGSPVPSAFDSTKCASEDQQRRSRDSQPATETATTAQTLASGMRQAMRCPSASSQYTFNHGNKEMAVCQGQLLLAPAGASDIFENTKAWQSHECTLTPRRLTISNSASTCAVPLLVLPTNRLAILHDKLPSQHNFKPFELVEVDGTCHWFACSRGADKVNWIVAIENIIKSNGNVMDRNDLAELRDPILQALPPQTQGCIKPENLPPSESAGKDDKRDLFGILGQSDAPEKAGAKPPRDRILSFGSRELGFEMKSTPADMSTFSSAASTARISRERSLAEATLEGRSAERHSSGDDWTFEKGQSHDNCGLPLLTSYDTLEAVLQSNSTTQDHIRPWLQQQERMTAFLETLAQDVDALPVLVAGQLGSGVHHQAEFSNDQHGQSELRGGIRMMPTTTMDHDDGGSTSTLVDALEAQAQMQHREIDRDRHRLSSRPNIPEVAIPELLTSHPSSLTREKNAIDNKEQATQPAHSGAKTRGPRMPNIQFWGGVDPVSEVEHAARWGASTLLRSRSGSRPRHHQSKSSGAQVDGLGAVEIAAEGFKTQAEQDGHPAGTRLDTLLGEIMGKLQELSEQHASREAQDEVERSAHGGLTKRERLELEAKRGQIRRLEAITQMNGKRQAQRTYFSNSGTELDEAIAKLSAKTEQQYKMLQTLVRSSNSQARSADRGEGSTRPTQQVEDLLKQVKVGVDEHVNDFRGQLTMEIQRMLAEVAKLGEDKKNLQTEIAELLSFQARYGGSVPRDPDIVGDDAFPLHLESEAF